MHMLKATMIIALSAFAVELYGQTGAQTPLAATAATPVPALVPYAAMALDANAKPLTGARSVTFLIYEDEQGSDPLWVETQTVTFDAAGQYQAQLGASSPTGIPLDVFASGAARWLEVQIAGQQQTPRIQILSVAYALKSADASTLGGLPSSAFVRADALPASTHDATAAVQAETTTGYVTSVGLSAPSSDFHVTGSPVTKSGTLGLHWNSAPSSQDKANTIVKRDANGNFAAGAITANAQLIGIGGANLAIAGNAAPGLAYAVGVTGQSATGIGVYGNTTTDLNTEGGVNGMSDDSTGVLGVNSGNGVGVYGTGGTGVLGEGTDLAFYSNGDVQQAPTASGWVKAMAYVNANGVITRCFNSTLAQLEKTPPCGLSVERITVGDYYANFNFEVDERFYLGRVVTEPGEAFVSPLAPKTLRIQLEAQGIGLDSDFTLIVF